MKSIISETSLNEIQIQTSVDKFFKENKIGSLLKQANFS